MKEEIFLPKNEPKETVSIYILTEPDGETVRYVGQAVEPPRRFFRHWASGGERLWHGLAPREKWIRRLRRRELIPRMFVIEIVPIAEGAAAEKKWILYYNSEGRQTLNCASNRGIKTESAESPVA